MIRLALELVGWALVLGLILAIGLGHPGEEAAVAAPAKPARGVVWFGDQPGGGE